MGHSRKRKHSENNEQTNDNKTENEIKAETENTENTENEATRSNINRRARIIVRNLSFKTTEGKLKEYFGKFGNILEVKLLKKPDGKLVGCGFIQYEVTQNAAKAIFETSGKPFLGRDIVCDWALGKSTYVRNMQEAQRSEIKQENDEVIEVKEEKLEEEDDKSKIEKINAASDDDNSNSESDDEDSEEEDEDDENEDDDEEDEEDYEDTESQLSQEPETKKPRIISNDVQEGKTIFIKNVPFSATNNDIKQCMEKFGPLHYALVCVDRLTEHSKGTAFVKFENQEDADKCLEAGTELTLMGQVLDCHRAISKDELDKSKQKKEVKKDSRNLYLVKEGVILAGSRAAQSVSATDMAKRLELERWKTQILRNLNMFVSKNRLIIHNLPQNYGDKELRSLFERFSGPTAVIKEARVMKDLRNLDESGKPVSKEHGFVSYADHEDALKALRAINNNPSIFTRTKRPIVAFSIENKAVVNAHNKRLIKSRINNPLSKEYNPNTPAANITKSVKEQQTNKTKNPKFRARDAAQQESEYTGVTSKPGRVDKMRSKYKLTTQAKIHQETLKTEKRKLKLTRRVLKKKQDDYLKQAKQKKGKGRKKPKDDNFSKLVDKYTANTTVKKSKKRKWYET